ncbi:hypothetical protein [Cysteiniphilum halobium]|uniref:hypothetical protein n=1 Tax=Cysteiniphilum halobium TaxID=2219059 RepID=UPI000E6537D7|nr:hypothetical protein [Cysteiniphilum halobium]
MIDHNKEQNNIQDDPKSSRRFNKKQIIISIVIILVIVIGLIYYCNSSNNKTYLAPNNRMGLHTVHPHPSHIQSIPTHQNLEAHHVENKVTSSVAPQKAKKQPKHSKIADEYLSVQDQIFKQNLKNELLKAQIQTKALEDSLNDTQKIVVGAVFKFNGGWQAILSGQGKTLQVSTGDKFHLTNNGTLYTVNSISEHLVTLITSQNKKITLAI